MEYIVRVGGERSNCYVETLIPTAGQPQCTLGKLHEAMRFNTIPDAVAGCTAVAPQPATILSYEGMPAYTEQLVPVLERINDRLRELTDEIRMHA